MFEYLKLMTENNFVSIKFHFDDSNSSSVKKRRVEFAAASDKIEWKDWINIFKDISQDLVTVVIKGGTESQIASWHSEESKHEFIRMTPAFRSVNAKVCKMMTIVDTMTERPLLISGNHMLMSMTSALSEIDLIVKRIEGMSDEKK